MGRKRRQPEGWRADQHVGHKPDPLTRAIATHSTEPVVVVAVGPSIRLLDCRTGEASFMDTADAHTGAVRSLAVSPDGRMLLSGSDDKTCKLWDLSTKKCLATWKMHKKLSAVTFTRDSLHALYADKFGDVAVANCSKLDLQPELLLGHCSAVVSSLAVSPDNKFVVSTDKDGKVRVSILPLPEAILHGAYQIQSFCVGHLNYATSAAFSTPPAAAGEPGRTLLLTGSGDGSVRLWDHLTGELLDVYIAAPPRQKAAQQQGGSTGGSEPASEGAAEGDQQQQQQEGGEQGPGSEGGADGDDDAGGTEGGEGGEGGQQEGGEEGEQKRTNAPDCAPVIDVSCSRDGSLAAALVEGEHEVQLIRVDHSSCKLALLQKLTLESVKFPCATSWDTQGRLWVVGGPPLDTSKSLHLGAAAAATQDGTSELSDVTAAVVSKEALSALEQRVEEEEKALAEGKLTPGFSAPLHSNIPDVVEGRKKRHVRNDEKEKVRLQHVRSQQQQQQKGKAS